VEKGGEKGKKFGRGIRKINDCCYGLHADKGRGLQIRSTLKGRRDDGKIKKR